MRLPNWPKLLTDAINSAQSRPFVWGEHDCCLFAADCALAITGVDAAVSWRGTYSDKAGADSIVNSHGGIVGLVTFACAGAGWRMTGIGHASRGDLVCFIGDDGPALGICLGSQGAFLTARGLSFRPISQCSAAWRVE